MTIGLVEYISPKWIKPLFKKLVKLRDTRQKELNVIGTIFGDPLELAKFYIEPHCQHINPADEDEEEPISVVTSPVFKTINMFLNGEFSNRGDGRSQMLVLADAGMGKTSLLLMFKLSHITSFFPRNTDCQLFKLGKSTMMDIKNIEQPTKTILLLDALDEDPEAWDDFRGRLLEILRNTSTFKRVIISCRTQFFPNNEIDPFKRIGKIKIGGYVCPMIFLSLFNDESVNNYLNKRFIHDDEKKNNAHNVIKAMGSLSFRPLLLSYIDGFIESEKTEWSEYEIFSTLIEAWLMREENKLLEYGYNINHKDLFLACLSIAKIMQMKKERTITESEFQEYKKDFPELANLEKIDLGGRSLLNKNSDGNYRFSHFSFQEFIVAYGVINKIYSLPNNSLWLTDKVAEFLSQHKELVVDFSLIQFKNSHLPKNINFSGIDMKNVDFSGSSWYSSIFSFAKFNYANGKGVDLSQSALQDTIFNNANLENGVFDGAFCVNASFENSNLKGASFLGANLKNANFKNANLSDSIFDSTILDGSILDGANVENASFIGVSLDKTSLLNVNLKDAIVNRSTLT